ncbi:MAG: sigma-54 dependent transcriptional regulator [Pyrinomonadaceae bacterium]
MPTENVLIVEDEELMRTILRQLVEGSGYQAYTADSAETALEVLSRNDIDLTLTDIKMSGKTGLALLDQIKTADPEALVIIMTAYSSVDTAVAALRKGAYDYLTKPFVNEDLLQTIKNALAHRRLFRENRYLRRELGRQDRFAEIVGESSQLEAVFDIVEKVAATSASVLIQGESGTGKELVARSIHLQSDRCDKPFLAINCGALPESLLDSELFGHIKGSFTGAVADKKGYFRATEGGTLFLDEVGDMPAALQVKLLRALQEREVTPVGSASSVPFDARVIAASNKVLEAEVSAGRFREDLYYRLNVVEIVVPPLRERRSDIPLLARHFISRSARLQGMFEKPITAEALNVLTAYTWPGNVRELEHVIERSLILSEDEIDIGALPERVSGQNRLGSPTPSHQTLEEVERDHVLKIMNEVGEDKSTAAHILGIDLSTLYRKLKRYENL